LLGRHACHPADGVLCRWGMQRMSSWRGTGAKHQSVALARTGGDSGVHGFTAGWLSRDRGVLGGGQGGAPCLHAQPVCTQPQNKQRHEPITAGTAHMTAQLFTRCARNSISCYYGFTELRRGVFWVWEASRCGCGWRRAPPPACMRDGAVIPAAHMHARSNPAAPLLSWLIVGGLGPGQHGRMRAAAAAGPCCPGCRAGRTEGGMRL